MIFIAIFQHLSKMKFALGLNNQRNEFWITNISKKNVSLSDLNISIPANSSVNLFDFKHYKHLTEQQVINSWKSGSIFLKRDKLFKREVPPKQIQDKRIILFDSNAKLPSRPRSSVEINRIKYEELEMEDDVLNSSSDEIFDSNPKSNIKGK